MCANWPVQPEFAKFSSNTDSLRGVSPLYNNKGTTVHICKTIGCPGTTSSDQDFCDDCLGQNIQQTLQQSEETRSLSDKYPQYYKSVGHLTEIDVYAVHQLFSIQDSSGCLQHSSKKLLLSGVRTGGKSAYHDIKEARDTLTRWLQLNPENNS